MNLSECWIGKIVKNKGTESIGHIVGLTYSIRNEVIVIVQFAGESFPREIHQGNLEIITKIN